MEYASAKPAQSSVGFGFLQKERKGKKGNKERKERKKARKKEERKMKRYRVLSPSKPRNQVL